MALLTSQRKSLLPVELPKHPLPAALPTSLRKSLLPAVPPKRLLPVALLTGSKLLFTQQSIPGGFSRREER